MGFVLVLAFAASAVAGPPRIYADDGTYLGDLSANQYAPNSISNRYGKYGNPYATESINNQYGKYGNPYSPHSPNNPYITGGSISSGSAPNIYRH